MRIWFTKVLLLKKLLYGKSAQKQDKTNSNKQKHRYLRASPAPFQAPLTQQPCPAKRPHSDRYLLYLIPQLHGANTITCPTYRGGGSLERVSHLSNLPGWKKGFKNQTRTSHATEVLTEGLQLTSSKAFHTSLKFFSGWHKIGNGNHNGLFSYVPLQREWLSATDSSNLFYWNDSSNPMPIYNQP